jgi:fluoride exporter
MTALWIALGGACGTLLRYGAGLACARTLGDALPYGTFGVNVLGSFGLALLSQLAAGQSLFGVPVTLVLGTGLLGGFTTYSSFNQETLRFAERGELARAAGYVLLTLMTCLVAGALGTLAGRAARG